MSLFSSLYTSVSGLSAQSNMLSAIGDNIANSNTAGYKDASAQFETMLGLSTGSSYDSGSVQTTIRYGISQQGTTDNTTSPTDLEVQGNGFFVVQNASGQTALTREGNFVQNAATGNLVNAAGFSLMGYPIDAATGAVGSTLQLINTASSGLQATPSTAGTLSVNLPSTATPVTGNLPSSNAADATYTDKASVTAYDDLGNAVNIDLYMTKTADNPTASPPNSTWEVTAYNAADAAAGGGFPYTSAALGTGTFTYDSTTGSLDSTSPTSLSVTIPNGNAINFDMSKSTQLAAAFAQTTVSANGNAPSALSSLSIGTDGTLSEVYGSGAKVASYKIPLATVESPNNLTPISGNAYQTNTASGNMTIGTAASNGLGSIASDSLEQSTVDIATELTNMIVTQRAYEANSKVLQSSSDLLSLINKLQI